MLPRSDRRLYPDRRRLLESFWQATFSVDGAARIGGAGHGLMLSRTQPRESCATRADAQRPIVVACRAVLPDGVPPRIMASRSLLVTDDPVLAGSRARDGILRWAEAARREGTVVPDAAPDDLIVLFDVNAGTPDQVIETLRGDDELASATDIVFQVHPVDPPHREVLRSLESIADVVAPSLGWKHPR